ncbi:leucine--tRNA ligase [Methanobrevibacter filiformis]|uniref:Leucine--tRNA ligase n=1 Tax=Methanobrevibacter filiformis TaxID=55758 RepID=A0A166C7Z3_9EURY|nr:leucine--tRNA ligase [Methanobrevibacter filiformis]KZX14224.1 leucine--tRNA ligase [Methanobrevibacter filiformis]
MTKEIEKKWQKRWDDAKLFQSDPNEKEKLFITVAYPYPSGAMHIGHGRTYTVPDVYARYKRMQGYNVLFPMGWHVTGAPVIGIASRIRDKDPWTLELYEKVHKVPKEELPKLIDPEYIVKYFSTEYHNVMSDMGYSIDWRREFRTTDPSYKKFVEWQLKQLKAQDLVKKGNHPVKYCPGCGNPIGDHDLLEGEGATINELTLLKFEIDGKYLVPATFRPETIYGATNLWMNPDVSYIEVEKGGDIKEKEGMKEDKNIEKEGDMEGDREIWIISEKSYNNLSNQFKDLKKLGNINPKELIGRFVKNPVTNTLHPILPASFVDPEYGSGEVFSVPAHAPADYIALQDLKNNLKLLEEYNLGKIVSKIEALNVVTLKRYSEIPAKDVIEKLQVKSQEDPKLEEATNELYKVEHSKGIISEHIPDCAGERVVDARESIKEKMIGDDLAEVMYDFSAHPVICRCGTHGVVKIMDNQWFLKYSDEDWKVKTRECLAQENIIPPEIRSNFDYYIGWLEDWACSRRIGLGTKLPWDSQWLIEPLTDSTIYMAYYTIAKYIKTMDPDILDDEFFNKVFLSEINENDSLSDEVKQIKEEFDYWYPLDWRLSAKDLVGNHLSFHMFHHATIFPKNKWPQGMVVFGMGLLEGNKMSSSKGNVILLSQAIEDYGADVVRLFLMSSAEPWQDFDWREKEVIGTKRRLEWFSEFADKIKEIKGANININNIEEVPLEREIDKWMISQLNLRIKDATIALESFQTRKALQDSFFLLKKDIDHYMYRTKHLIETKDSAVIYALSTVLKTWIKILAPFTPHTCEELWNTHGGEGFVIEEQWPIFNEDLIDVKIEKSEEIIQNIVKDIKHINDLTKKDAEKVHVYTAPEWKWKVYELADEIGKPDIGQIIGKSIKTNLNDNKKELSEFAKKITREMTKTKYVGKVDEIAILNNAIEFISEESGAEIIIHEDNSYDPKNKSKHAIPYKPALYIE